MGGGGTMVRGVCGSGDRWHGARHERAGATWVAWCEAHAAWGGMAGMGARTSTSAMPPLDSLPTEMPIPIRNVL